LNADVLISTGHGLIGNNIFAYCLNNPASNKDDNGFVSMCITEGATTWKNESNANVSSGNLGKVISGAVNIGTAIGNYKIGDKIASKLGGFTKYREWTYNPSTYIYKLNLTKPGKALNGLKVVGAVTVGVTTIQTLNSIRKGEIYGAAIDIGATAAGVGVGCLTSGIAAFAITSLGLVAAPAAIVTALGAGAGILGSYVISLGADYWKDKHYGR